MSKFYVSKDGSKIVNLDLCGQIYKEKFYIHSCNDKYRINFKGENEIDFSIGFVSMDERVRIWKNY